jgi:hypothetical protein
LLRVCVSRCTEHQFAAAHQRFRSGSRGRSTKRFQVRSHRILGCTSNRFSACATCGPSPESSPRRSEPSLTKVDHDVRSGRTDHASQLLPDTRHSSRPSIDHRRRCALGRQALANAYPADLRPASGYALHRLDAGQNAGQRPYGQETLRAKGLAARYRWWPLDLAFVF